MRHLIKIALSIFFSVGLLFLTQGVVSGQVAPELYGKRWQTYARRPGVITISDDGIATLKTDGSDLATISVVFPLHYKGDSIEIICKTKYTGALPNSYGPMFFINIYNYYSGDIMIPQPEPDPRMLTKDWEEDRIVTSIRDDSKDLVIYFNAPLSGEMSIDMASIKVFVDGQEYDRLTEGKYPFLEDNEFDKGSGIRSPDITCRNIDNIALLGKVWGFLKYHHPAAGGFGYNWDYELFRILPSVIYAKNIEQTEAVLYDWVKSLEDYAVAGTGLSAITLGYINEMNISNRQLLAEMKRIGCAGRVFNKYASVGIATDFSSEAAYNSIDIHDAGYSILALLRYWNAVNYYFPYKYAIGRDWNDVLYEFLPEFVQVKDELDYVTALMKLAAATNDTHAMRPWSLEDSAIFGKGMVQVYLRYIEGQYVVTHVKDEAGLNIGDIILAVNGIPAEKMAERLYPYIAASNESGKKRQIASNLLRSSNDSLQVSFQRDGKQFERNFYCMPDPSAGSPMLATLTKTPYIIERNNVVYYYPINDNPDAWGEIVGNIHNYDGLILDLRCYPTRFNADIIYPYLFNEPHPYAKGTSPSSTVPGKFDKETILKAGKTGAELFEGRIVILVDEYTQSMAEFLAMSFQPAQNVTTIGTQTAGADGNTAAISVPRGYSLRFTGAGVYYPDGGETQRAGIRIDEIIEPTIDGILHGNDPVIERAFEICRKTTR